MAVGVGVRGEHRQSRAKRAAATAAAPCPASADRALDCPCVGRLIRPLNSKQASCYGALGRRQKKRLQLLRLNDKKKSHNFQRHLTPEYSCESTPQVLEKQGTSGSSRESMSMHSIQHLSARLPACVTRDSIGRRFFAFRDPKQRS
jgi:hypothetical protein